MAKRERILGSKISALGLGLAGGIIVGACMLLMTVFGIIFNWTPQFLNMFIDMHRFLGRMGYDISTFGILLGTIYGFIEGFLFFWILGLLYNKLR